MLSLKHLYIIPSACLLLCSTFLGDPLWMLVPHSKAFMAIPTRTFLLLICTLPIVIIYRATKKLIGNPRFWELWKPFHIVYDHIFSYNYSEIIFIAHTTSNAEIWATLCYWFKLCSFFQNYIRRTLNLSIAAIKLNRT